MILGPQHYLVLRLDACKPNYKQIISLTGRLLVQQ